MTEHRSRGWLRFGVLDLLILISAVAVVAVLCRPEQTRINKAKPWVVGGWGFGPEFYLLLFPDGSFDRQRWVSDGLGGETVHHGWGRWTLTRVRPATNAFVLECGEFRSFIRREWDSDVMELRKEDGSVMAEIEKVQWFEGPAWRITYTPGGRHGKSNCVAGVSEW